MKVLPDPRIPLKPSPFNQRTYQWRLIDFEYAVKVNFARTTFRRYYNPSCMGMFSIVSKDIPEEYFEGIEEETEDGDD